MSDEAHDLMKDLLPELAAGTLDNAQTARLEALLATDADLRAELELIECLRRTRPEPPADLNRRIRAGLARPAAGHRWIRWPLSTAAILLLSLGTAWLWSGRQDSGSGTRVDEPVAWAFPADDDLVAGAMILADLTDAELEALLEEMGA